MSNRKVIIIEGVNFAEKSRVFDHLKELMRGSTEIRLHDWCYKQLIALYNGNEELAIQQLNSGGIPLKTIRSITSYNFGKIRRVIRQMKAEYLDNFLFERLHGTDYVYRNFLFGETSFGKTDFITYAEIEEELNEEGAGLILVTAGDDVIRDRVRAAMHENRRTGNNLDVPDHLRDMDMLRRKRDLYDAFFDASKTARKLSVETDHSTDYKQVARGIRNFMYMD